MDPYKELEPRPSCIQNWWKNYWGRNSEWCKCCGAALAFLILVSGMACFAVAMVTNGVVIFDDDRNVPVWLLVLGNLWIGMVVLSAISFCIYQTCNGTCEEEQTVNP